MNVKAKGSTSDSRHERVANLESATTQPHSTHRSRPFPEHDSTVPSQCLSLGNTGRECSSINITAINTVSGQMRQDSPVRRCPGIQWFPNDDLVEWDSSIRIDLHSAGIWPRVARVVNERLESVGKRRSTHITILVNARTLVVELDIVEIDPISRLLMHIDICSRWIIVPRGEPGRHRSMRDQVRGW